MIDVDDALRGLTLAVKERGPDHVDPLAAQGRSCSNVYEHEGEVCRCIAGEALSQLGIDDITLNKFSAAFGAISYVDITDAASNLLAVAQSTQDAGKTWGEAHKKAAVYHNWKRMVG